MIFFDPKKKAIVWRSKKRLKVGTQPNVVTMIEKIVMQCTNQDPVFLTSVNIAAAQANADNIVKLVEDVEHYKEIMCKMKKTLVK